MFKRKLIRIAALTLLLFSLNSFADPHFLLGFNFGALNTLNNDLDYAVINNGPTNNIQTIEPGFGFGWGVWTGYEFSNDSALLLSWFTLNNRSTNSISTSPNQIIRPPFETSSPLPATSAIGWVDFCQHDIDLMYDRVVKKWDDLMLEILSGARYIRLQRDINNTYINSVTSTTITVNPISKFQGAGPRVAARIVYRLYHEFSFVTEFGGSLLIGRANTNDVHTNSNSGVVFRVLNNAISRFVPEFDGQVGFRYTTQLGNRHPHILLVEVGVYAADYIDAIDRAEPIFDDSFNLLAIQRHTSSYGLWGPYLMLATAF